MSDGPTGPVYPDWEFIQGDAFYVNRMTSDASYLTRAATLPPPITHPFPTCDCSACEIRRLKDQIQQLTKERDEAQQRYRMGGQRERL